MKGLDRGCTWFKSISRKSFCVQALLHEILYTILVVLGFNPFLYTILVVIGFNHDH
jgi:hypothetical protein